MFGIVINPISGGGENARLIARLRAAIAERGGTSRVFATSGADDGGRQARLALEAGCGAIVGVGGDGTLSEIIGPVAGSGAELYIVPSGTGNDFARAFGLPRDPIRAFAAQLDGVPAAIDCPTINGRPFLNVSGSGFDVAVLRRTEELKAVYPGEKAYHKAVVAVLGEYRPFEAELTLEDGTATHERTTIIEFANGQYIGGGMRVAPGSACDDGLLDVVVVGSVPRRAIPFLLPLFIKGWHVHLPICRVARVRSAVLRAPGMVVNIDGRLEAMDEAVFSILPGALRMRRPANP